MKKKNKALTIVIIVLALVSIILLQTRTAARGASLTTCGDNYCTAGESTICPNDCAHNNKCGDGVCSGCPSLTNCGTHPSVGENHDNCPIDCYLEGDASTSTSRKLYETYETYDQVVAQLKGLETQYPGLVNHEIIGKSYQGKDIYLFKVGNPNGGSFMFDGRPHGMEDCGTENGIAFIKWVLTNNSIDSNNVKNGNYLLFIPGINIDSTRRQNMNRENNILWGVDLNRNGITGWTSGGNSDPTSVSTYRGPSAGSEPETKAYMVAMNKYKPEIYMNVHCGMRMLNGAGPLTSTILANIKSNANKYSRTNTQAWYLDGQGGGCSGGGQICSAGKSITGVNGNGWIHETTYHGSLPVSLNDYLSKIYSQAFPIYLGMAQAVQNTVVPPDNCLGITCPNKCEGNILKTGGHCTEGICQYSSQTCPNGCSNAQCTQSDLCVGITCNDKCEGDTLFKNGVCQSGTCQYTQIICQYGCGSNTCKTGTTDDTINDEPRTTPNPLDDKTLWIIGAAALIVIFMVTRKKK